MLHRSPCLRLQTSRARGAQVSAQGGAGRPGGAAPEVAERARAVVRDPVAEVAARGIVAIAAVAVRVGAPAPE